MKLIVVSNGTKEGTFVRNADTGEALEGVEHIAFNYDGEKCVITVMLTTGLVVSDVVPKAPDTSRGLPEDDGFLDPAAALNALKALDKGAQVDYGMGLKRCEDCNVVLSEGACSGRVSAHGLCPECGERAPHAHHKEEGGVRLSTKHIPRSPADIATELEKDPGNESLRKELGDAIDKGVDFILSAIGHKVPKPPAKPSRLVPGVYVEQHSDYPLRITPGLGEGKNPAQCEAIKSGCGGNVARCKEGTGHDGMHDDGALRWNDDDSRVPDPLAHCSYCKLYYCDMSTLAGHADQICPESSDHKHKWVPPFTAFKPPPVLPTRIEKQEVPVGYLGLVERAPHCDAFVLHLKRDCRTCAMPEFEPLHVWRKEHRVNHTGEYDPLKAVCPAELRRSKEVS